LSNGDNTVEVLVDWEQEVKDDATVSIDLLDNCYRRDFQIRWAHLDDVIPEEHAAETSFDLVLDILLN
jgi:hypothetical protein